MLGDEKYVGNPPRLHHPLNIYIHLLIILDNLRLTFVIEQEPTNGYDTTTRKGWKSVKIEGLTHSSDASTDLNINWTGDVMWGRRMECLEYECLQTEYPSDLEWGGAWACDAQYPWTCPVSCEWNDDINIGECHYTYTTPEIPGEEPAGYGEIVAGTCEVVEDCYQHTVCAEYNLDNCLIPGILRNGYDGSYIFKVKAIGAFNISSNTVEYPFTIHPPWWLTSWAKIAYCISYLFLIYSYVYWKTNHLKSYATNLKTKQKELKHKHLLVRAEVLDPPKDLKMMRKWTKNLIKDALDKDLPN